MDGLEWPWQTARRALLRRKHARPFVPSPAPGRRPRAALAQDPADDSSPQAAARAWLREVPSPWLPPLARTDTGPFRRTTSVPVVLAASASAADGDSNAPPRPFDWVDSPAPKIPVIPTVLWHVPRPVKPLIDLNEVMNNCIARGVLSFVAGGVLGLGMGVLIGSWQLSGHSPEAGLSDPRQLTARQALREMLTLMRTKALSWGRNFAVVGSIYSTVECYLASGRGRHDIKNPVVAGCITGGALAVKQGPVAVMTGCAGFAAFSLVIEQFMHAGQSPLMMGMGEHEEDA